MPFVNSRKTQSSLPAFYHPLFWPLEHGQPQYKAVPFSTRLTWQLVTLFWHLHESFLAGVPLALASDEANPATLINLASEDEFSSASPASALRSSAQSLLHSSLF